MLQVEGVVDDAATIDVNKPIKKMRVGKPKVKTGCITCKYVFG